MIREVISLYYRFVESLPDHNPGYSERKMNDMEAAEAMESLRKIISATNDFVAKYLQDKDLIKYGLIYELRGFCDHISNTYDELFAFFSQEGEYFKVSELFDAQTYSAIINLLWHAIERDTTWVLVSVVAKKNQLQVMIDTNIACYNNMDTSKEITINIALDYIQKLGGVLAIESGNDAFRLILTIPFNKTTQTGVKIIK